jgi:F-type H+-transporting ATPase subunit alpha
LESFAKFGTRLDASTRQSIDHGLRIRACLNQSESQPMSLIEQIIVLLGLTAGLLDPVAIEKVDEAEQALRNATTEISADIADRLSSAEKLSDSDRQFILDVAVRTLASFHPALESKPVATPAT